VVILPLGRAGGTRKRCDYDSTSVLWSLKQQLLARGLAGVSVRPCFGMLLKCSALDGHQDPHDSEAPLILGCCISGTEKRGLLTHNPCSVVKSARSRASPAHLKRPSLSEAGVSARRPLPPVAPSPSLQPPKFATDWTKRVIILTCPLSSVQRIVVTRLLAFRDPICFRRPPRIASWNGTWPVSPPVPLKSIHEGT
jgi:hypothetical protein